MNRRSLFKGAAALLGVAAIGPTALAREYATGGPKQRFQISSARTGVIQAGSIRSEDGSFLANFDTGTIRIVF